jgi:predicted Fe-Mo cluster-binding NifX family protein
VKIAVTSQGASKESPVDPRFGRAKYFVIYDTGTAAFSANDNVQNLSAAQGAGIQSAGAVDGLGCRAVITGHCGPKAFTALSRAGIDVYAGASGSVEEAIRSYTNGKLRKLSAADVEGHW